MTNISSQKLRGGYYTPKPIAKFLAQWAIRSNKDRILEPSCGDGNILVAVTNHLLELGVSSDLLHQQILGIEMLQEEASIAVERLHDLTSSPAIHNSVAVDDFFNYCKEHLLGEKILNLNTKDRKEFDVVIGNPPFIRYQNFPEKHRQIAFGLMRQVGLNPNRLTNAWLPFLILGSILLSPDGRLAMVIPTELFQVNYAAEARLFLSDYFKRVTLVTFKTLVFENIQQEVILLLAEKNHTPNNGIRSIELNDVSDLDNITPERLNTVELKPMNHSTEKWTQYFLDAAEIHLLREIRENPNLTFANEILDIDVGIVTGRNGFFVLTKEEAQTNKLEPYLDRMVSRSGHLEGAIFSAEDWQKNVNQQLPAFLFTPDDVEFKQLPDALQKYIIFGENQKYHNGYKCRIRNRWYVVPSVWIPEAFMLRQVHAYPKLVLNTAQAVCTDTIHRVRFTEGVKGETVVAAYLNSLTFAFSEVTGRSYGGGVLTFEPSEAERLPIPLLGAENLDINQFDCLLRKNKINTILDITDKVLLEGGLGLSKSHTKMLRNIWMKLRNRRINRK